MVHKHHKETIVKAYGAQNDFNPVLLKSITNQFHNKWSYQPLHKQIVSKYNYIHYTSTWWKACWQFFFKVDARASPRNHCARKWCARALFYSVTHVRINHCMSRWYPNIIATKHSDLSGKKSKSVSSWANDSDSSWANDSDSSWAKDSESFSFWEVLASLGGWGYLGQKNIFQFKKF